MRGKVFALVLVVFLGAYVLFGIDDPVELFDGLVTIIKKLAQKGEWVKEIWSAAVKGDFKSVWEFAEKLLGWRLTGIIPSIIKELF